MLKLIIGDTVKAKDFIITVSKIKNEDYKSHIEFHFKRILNKLNKLFEENNIDLNYSYIFLNYTFIKCLNLIKYVDYNKFIDLISVFDYDQIDNNTYEKLKNDFKTKQTNFFDEMFNNYLKYVAQLPTYVDSLQYVITLLILYDLEDINEAYNSELALDFIDNLLSIRHNIINNDFNNFYVIKNDYDIKRIKDNI